MTNAVTDSIREKLSRIKQYKTEIKNAISSKGGTIDDTTTLKDYSTILDATDIGGSAEPVDFVSLCENGFSKTYESFFSAKRVKPYFFYQESLSSCFFPYCSEVGEYAFFWGSSFKEINMPLCVTVGNYAFTNCEASQLTLKSCKSIGSCAFFGCYSLTSIDLPACNTIESNAFCYCTKLSLVKLSRCTFLGDSAFYGCSLLTSFYLLGSNFCSLSDTTTFFDTPIDGYSLYAGKYGSVFVRASLLNVYQNDSLWSRYSKRFVGLTDSEIETLNAGE